jgi:hypothetical protein
LLIVFRGKVAALIPLFAVGLFTAFTLSQTGMVRHHLRLREKGWKVGAAVNAVGAIATSIILVVVLVSKFTEGAWVPAVVIPTIVMVFKGIRKHYARVARVLAVPPGTALPVIHNTVVLPVPEVNRGVFNALAYAKSLHPERLVALVVELEDTDISKLKEEWAQYQLDVPLETIESPYRDFTRPVLAFLDSMESEHSDDVITVVIPEFVVRRWWEQVLHNQSALLLKARLLFRSNTVVISVPTQID